MIGAIKGDVVGISRCPVVTVFCAFCEEEIMI